VVWAQTGKTSGWVQNATPSETGDFDITQNLDSARKKLAPITKIVVILKAEKNRHLDFAETKDENKAGFFYTFI
jgi:hypothetical protein